MMLTLFFHCLLEWNDFYKDVSYSREISDSNEKINFNEEQSKSLKLYVHGCHFEGLKGTVSSGAIYIDTKDHNFCMLVEETSFIKCSSKVAGGAMAYNQTGSCIISKICGYECKSSKYAHFYIINVKESGRNECYLSTFSHANHNKQHTTRSHVCGIITNSEVNTSSNHNYQYAGLVCSPSSVGTIKLSTFVNNTSVEDSILCLGDGWANIKNGDTDIFGFEFSQCNVMNNMQVKKEKVSADDFAILFMGGETKVKNSCFLNNKAKFIFFQGHPKERTEFTSVVTNCIISGGGKIVTGDIEIMPKFEKTPTYTFFNLINHYEYEDKKYCAAEFNQDNGYVYEKRIIFSCHKRLGISSVKSMAFVFLAYS